MSVPIERYQLRWRITGSGQEWQTRSYVPNGQALTIPSLEADKTYDIEARSVGINKRVSAWVAVTKLAKGNPNLNILTKDSIVFASSSTNADTITATTPAFTPNTASRRISSTYNFNSEKVTGTNDGSSESGYGGTVAVEVSVSGGAWTQIASYGLTGKYGQYAESSSTTYISFASGQITLADGTSGDVSYRARQISGVMQAVSGGSTSRYIDIKVEDI